MKKSFIVGFLFNMLFLVFFFSLKDNFPIMLLNVISFLSVAEPINSYILIKEHNKTIKWLNDNNPETLRNYQVHNPLAEHNENANNLISNRTTSNIIYQSLNTDSSESDEAFGSLNIVIEN
tara:strand:- start:1288 stop:1650 length:363 start_codon:yes stop_codon:yes gene_type:complete